VKFCSECGAKLNVLGRCSMSAAHDVEQGGFCCPGCGQQQKPSAREGSACAACRAEAVEA
jgi:hypothetical protein